MLQRRKQCKFFNSSAGCHRGEYCRFVHTIGTTSPPVSPLSQTRTRIPQSHRYPGNPSADIPRNTCLFFWTTGACARGFECTYQHTKPANDASAQNQTAEITAVDGGDSVIDFFSSEGLAISTGSLHEDRYNLNPSEVHNYLKEFLRDTYSFDTATQAQKFVRVLASVNDRNKSWVCTNFNERSTVLMIPNAKRTRKKRKSF